MRSFLGILIATLALPQASAGEFSKGSFSRNFDWESTDCYKPDKPFVIELSSYLQWEIESYLDDVDAYRDCIINEAEADLVEARRKMLEAVQSEIDRLNDEIDNDMQDLQIDLQLAQ